MVSTFRILYFGVTQLEKIKVGVIGVGHLGRHHARIYTEIPDVELTGVVDKDKKQAEAIGDSLNVPAYSDLQLFLREKKPQAMSIVVPTTEHFSIAQELLSQGIHVLVEKPVTTTFEQAEELSCMAEKSGIIAQVGHIERFNSAFRFAARQVKKPICIQSRRQGPFTARVGDVGVVLDLMIHDIDLALALAKSKIRSISATGRKVCSEHEDIALAQLIFENGMMAALEASRICEHRLRQMDITEQNRYISINFETQDAAIYHSSLEADSEYSLSVETLEKPTLQKTEPLKLELQSFIRCVRTGERPEVSIADGGEALKVASVILEKIALCQ